MRLRRTVILGGWSVVLLAAAALGWVQLEQRHLAASRALHNATAQATQTETAPAPAPIRVAAQGRVEPISEKFELAIGMIGPLAGVYVAEGDGIKKGELLAELVNGDQKARVAEAEAQIALRRAELEKLLNGARPEERHQVAAQFAKTEEDVALAKLQLARKQPLAARGVESREVLDQTASSFRVAQANNDASRAALDLINAPPRAEDVAIAKANLALAEGNLAEQRVLLEKSQLRSPIDGVVLRRYLKTGETISVQPLLPILQVGDTRKLRVRAQVDESDVGRIERGQRAWVTAPGYPNQRFAGSVSRVGESMGPKTVRSDDPSEKADTNTLDVLIDLDDSGLRLPNGLRVNVFVDSPRSARN